jgi:hypothetical protein
MAIMDYANEGNLRGCLTKIIENNWKQKLYMLFWKESLYSFSSFDTNKNIF